MEFTDVLYEVDDAFAVVTINRPKVMNAFRSQTVDELIEAFRQAWADRSVGAVILTGAGEGKNAFLEKRKPNFRKFRT